VIIVDWGDADETFLVCKVEFECGNDDVTSAVHTINTLARHSPQPVALIVDLQRASVASVNVIAMARWSLLNLHTQVGNVIVVARFSFWQSIYNTIRSVYKQDQFRHVTFVDHPDDAYALVEGDALY
jgi:hypothetical protein